MFSQEELFDILIRHARHDDPRISLAATRQLQLMLREVANVSGLIGRAKVVKEIKREDGSTTHHSLQSTVVRGQPSRLAPPTPPTPPGTGEFLPPA